MELIAEHVNSTAGLFAESGVRTSSMLLVLDVRLVFAFRPERLFGLMVLSNVDLGLTSTSVGSKLRKPWHVVRWLLRTRDTEVTRLFEQSTVQFQRRIAEPSRSL